jgi:hypothetical protein
MLVQVLTIKHLEKLEALLTQMTNYTNTSLTIKSVMDLIQRELSVVTDS